jgi:hypothetical protein
MKILWILAAATTFAACHNRSEDEMGAAPDRGDTPAVQSGYDTTMAQPAPSPSTSGYDKASTQPATSEPTTPATKPAPAAPPSTSSYDTTGTTANPSAGMGTDSTLSPGAGGTVQADSAGTSQ